MTINVQALDASILGCGVTARDGHAKEAPLVDPAVVDFKNLTPIQRQQITQAAALIGTSSDWGPLAEEASRFGIGLGRVIDLSDGSAIDGIVDPVRRVMDPQAANAMLDAITRQEAAASPECI